MASDSRYLRYREAGEEANQYNVERFGQPARSLFTSGKIFSLHNKITITDENENVLYKVQSKVFSIHDKTDIVRDTEEHVAHIESKVFSLHEKHTVTMEDGTQFTLSTEILHIVKDVINIEGLGWQIQGNIAALNFELYDENGEIVALISQKMLSLHDKYCIDIYQPEKEEIVVAILITLQHIMQDREAAEASAGSSIGSAISSLFKN